MDVNGLYGVFEINSTPTKLDYKAFNICLDSNFALKLLGRRIFREEKEQVTQNGLQKIIQAGLVFPNKDVLNLNPYLFVKDKASLHTALLDTCRFEGSNITLMPKDLDILQNTSGRFLIRYGAYKVKTDQEVQRLVMLFHNWLEYFSERK